MPGGLERTGPKSKTPERHSWQPPRTLMLKSLFPELHSDFSGRLVTVGVLDGYRSVTHSEFAERLEEDQISLRFHRFSVAAPGGRPRSRPERGSPGASERCRRSV